MEENDKTKIMLNKKRGRPKQKSLGKTNSKNKIELAQIKAINKILKIKPNFMAKLNENIKIDEIIKGDDIIFEHRKNKSKKIFEDIDKLDINDSNNYKKISDEINRALSYDNINKKNLYKSLKYFQKIKDEIDYKNIMEKAKYGLTQKFDYIDENNNTVNIDLCKELNISDKDIIFSDEKEILNEIIQTINSLELIYERINKIKIDELTKEEILKSKIIKNKDNFYLIEEKKTDNNDLQIIYKNIYTFLFNYVFINNYQYYGVNQPLDYNYNTIIYLINIFYRIYDNTTIIVKKGRGQFVLIDENKMKKISYLKSLKEYILLLLKNNNNKINEEIDKNLDLYLYYLESEKLPDDLKDIIDESIKRNIPLTIDKIQQFIKNNKNKEKYFSCVNDKLYLKYQDKDYEFIYKNYNENLLDILRDINNPDFIKQSLWNTLSMINYFDDEDISYMKNLLKKILSSKLFKDIFKNNSNVEKCVDYYFNENKNIDDLLNRIKLLPFDEIKTGRQGATIPKQLKIIVSSKYKSKIESKDDFNNFKIVEIGRKIIIILHEITHYIKRALNLITNGKVIESTIENDKEDTIKTECGRLFELLMFNWENPFVKKRAKSAKNEREEYSKILNIKKALKLLDPNTYNKNINEFQEYFYNNEENEESNMNEELKKYLKKINFDINDYKKNKINYSKYKINVSRNVECDYSIEYISDNHNYHYRFKKVKLGHN